MTDRDTNDPWTPSPSVHPHPEAQVLARSRLRPSGREWILASTLFVATGLSTTLRGGAAFGAWLLLILLCHELGHYITARRYHVATSLPLFIPLPISPFGTMGAVIQLRQRIRTRRVLFDIGIAGPLAGIPPSLVATVWGLANSRVVDGQAIGGGSLQLGSSLLFAALERHFFPGLGPGQEILLHPVAFAGWAGLFVTSLNLLPIGQLDGGHILYGLLGRASQRISWVLAPSLAVAGFWFPGWWVLLFFLILTRLRHPSTQDEAVPLGRGRVWLGVFALGFFVLTFIPRPIAIP